MPEENNLEKYLTEPIPLTENLTELSKRIAQTHEDLQGLIQYENLTLGAVKTLKSPESHNPAGVMGIYRMYKALLEGLEEQREKIGNGYEIIINVPGYDKITTVRPQETVDVWNYRLEWLDDAIGCLAFIYKSEIKKAIDDQQKTLEEMTQKYF